MLNQFNQKSQNVPLITPEKTKMRLANFRSNFVASYKMAALEEERSLQRNGAQRRLERGDNKSKENGEIAIRRNASHWTSSLLVSLIPIHESIHPGLYTKIYSGKNIILIILRKNVFK